MKKPLKSSTASRVESLKGLNKIFWLYGVKPNRATNIIIILILQSNYKNIFSCFTKKPTSTE